MDWRFGLATRTRVWGWLRASKAPARFTDTVGIMPAPGEYPQELRDSLCACCHAEGGHHRCCANLTTRMGGSSRRGGLEESPSNRPLRSCNSLKQTIERQPRKRLSLGIPPCPELVAHSLTTRRIVDTAGELVVVGVATAGMGQR